MNKHNVEVWEENGELIAEWADRAPDDEDRYAKDSVILIAKVPASGTMKQLWSEMATVYDRWIRETR